GSRVARRAPHCAGALVFGLSRWQILEASDEPWRIFAVDHRDRAGLAFAPIFARNDRSVPALMIELNRDFGPGVHLHPINRGVYPAFIGVAHYHQRTGADKRSAILPMPIWRRQLIEIDINVAQHVF